jgi:DNA-binding NarL/FixJ family response regulator
MIEVLLVDDQTLFVESLKVVIENDADDIRVLGIVHNGKQALQFLETHRPDIVFLDIRMPVMDGVEATKEIHKRYPDIKIMILTTFDDDEYVSNALDYGAVGYLLKDIPSPELIGAIRSINAGTYMMSPTIARKLISKAYHDQGEWGPRREDDADGDDGYLLDDLKKRELEILRLMAQGLGNKQICEKLFIADQTVRNHISMIYSKLDVHSRYDAIQKAIRLGLI